MSRRLPHNIEAERGLLALVLLDRDGSVWETAEHVKAEQFAFTPHREIWRAICQAKARGAVCADGPTIWTDLQSCPVIEAEGGWSYLLDVIDTFAVPIQAADYVKQIETLAWQRDVIRAADDVITVASIGGDTAGALAALAAIKAPAGRERFRMLDLAGMQELEPPTWLVRHWLPDRSKVVLFGRSNVGKSFAAVDLACSVAAGVDWQAHPVQQGPVIYIAGEGAYGVAKQRIPGWFRARSISGRSIPIRVIPEAILLSEPGEADALLQQCVETFGRAPALVVVDVLKRCMSGTDRDDKDTGAYIRGIDTLVAAGATVLTITHSGHGDADRARGDSDLWGSFDTRLKAEGDPTTRTLRLICDRHKDAETPAPMSFRLVSVETGGIDAHGAPMTTLVPERDDTAAPSAGGSKARLTDEQKAFFAEVVNAIAANGRRIQPYGDDGPTVTATPRNTLRTTLVERGVFDSATPANAQRVALCRHLNRLKGKGLLGVSDKWVWLTKPSVTPATQAQHPVTVTPGDERNIRNTLLTECCGVAPPVAVSGCDPGLEGEAK